jgi:hypothetical protein
LGVYVTEGRAARGDARAGVEGVGERYFDMEHMVLDLNLHKS